MLRSHSLGEHSVFEKTLEAGLSAMKTHQCFLDKTKSNGCPGKVLSSMKSDFKGSSDDFKNEMTLVWTTLKLSTFKSFVLLDLDNSLLRKT